MSMDTQLHVSCVTPYQYWVYFSNELRSRIKLWEILNCVFACIVRPSLACHMLKATCPLTTHAPIIGRASAIFTS